MPTKIDKNADILQQAVVSLADDQLAGFGDLVGDVAEGGDLVLFAGGPLVDLLPAMINDVGEGLVQGDDGVADGVC